MLPSYTFNRPTKGLLGAFVRSMTDEYTVGRMHRVESRSRTRPAPEETEVLNYVSDSFILKKRN